MMVLGRHDIAEWNWVGLFPVQQIVLFSQELQTPATSNSYVINKMETKTLGLNMKVVKYKSVKDYTLNKTKMKRKCTYNNPEIRVLKVKAKIKQNCIVHCTRYNLTN
jgi:hypothetical protein